jgi:ribonuclease HI
VNDAATIAIIARNEYGLITKSWAKSVNSCGPLMAEAAAILWAIQVAKVENWSSIIIESDSKMCVDAILQDPPDSLWKIAVLCDNVKTLAAEFRFCCFNWVKREANMVAHTFAKAVPQANLPVILFPNNLPTAVEEVWFRDFACISVAV